MQLKPVDTPDLLRTVAGWLSQKENYQWLDFVDGRQAVSPEWLKISIQRGSLAMRVFTADDTETPIGVVGFSGVNPHFKTGTLWVVLGDKAYAGHGYGSRATSRMLSIGFSELGFKSIQTWIVEHNPSVRVAARVKFRPIGRQRQCHLIDGRTYDRLWYDLLPSEYEALSDDSEHSG
jgi:RimJ/RimL family protein N-acetyltransferase